jgi:sarcosine oxidase
VRVVVVGAGIMGACAALETARGGADVTIFEQYEIDHDRGSSFGDSRIIRRFYDDAYYTQLMASAYPLWERLAADAGATLYERLGGLYFGPRDHPRLRAAASGMRSAGAAPAVLDARALRARYPAFSFDDGEAGLVDVDAGSLRASRCVRAALRAARDAGVRVRTRTHVESVASRLGGVQVRFGADASDTFDRAIVCAGPWTSRLIPALAPRLRPTRQQYVHLMPTRDAAAFRPPAMPIWIDAANDWYGFPEHGDVPGVKIASHVFGDVVDPDDVLREIDDAAVVQTREYARRRFPALADGDVTYAKVCLYTVSPDEDFIVDVAPDMPGCVFIAGCSGHAFKFGPLLGAVASDLALDREPRVDIARFRTARFAGERDHASSE